MNKITIKIPLLCRPKKNHQRIVTNRYTGEKHIIQSDRYLEFERNCAYFLKKYEMNINTPVNLKCTFIVPDKRRRDIVNLLNGIQDILVKYKVLNDDNYNIIKSVDGTRIVYEKNHEETIIEITDYTE